MLLSQKKKKKQKAKNKGKKIYKHVTAWVQAQRVPFPVQIVNKELQGLVIVKLVRVQ